MPDRDTSFSPDDTATDVDQPNPRCPHCAGRIIVTVVAGRTWQDVPFFRAGDRARDRAVFDDLKGRYLTDLTEPRWLDAPIPARGMLGLWPAPVDLSTPTE